MSVIVRALLAVGVLCGALSTGCVAQGIGVKPIVIDASAAAQAPGAANYAFAAAEARSPDGHVLGLNARYLTLDGKPWLPVMGEMHYTRVPEAEWEEQILKMKSAGVQIVAAYIIWIHHEEVEGEWDWKGQKDLRHFAELCQKHGMYVVARIGPWSHAEVRNGGFPDWLMAKATQQRQNDPTYLGYVDQYYKQIGAQLKGLMWSEGGPVVAVQLENEYRGHGALGGVAHILKLKEMAREAGLKVPFYTVTDWDGASIPAGEVLPVGGGYPDAPWDASIVSLPASGVYAFHIRDRSTIDMGAQNAQAPMVSAAHVPSRTPYITAEMGGGMQVTYHRRPVVSADDIAAMVPVMLGSGVNLYGSYMFQGGENPDGKLSTLQESLATHAPNDLPVKSYDFEAFLGEFGDERPSLFKEKSWNYFMNDFGPELAPMEPRRPDVMPSGPGDLSVVRVAARTAGGSGFLFVNNHVRGSAMPARPGFQVEVTLPEGKVLRIPEKPVDVPADAFFVWPFGLDLGAVKLRYATAQPLARLGTEDAPVYAFFAQPGIRPDFVVENAPGMKFELPPESTGGVETRDGAIHFWGLQADRRHGDSVRLVLADGRTVTLLLLSEEEAEHAWKIEAGGMTAMVTTPQQAFVDGGTMTLADFGAKEFKADVIPGNAMRLVAAEKGLTLGHSGADVTASSAAAGLAVVPLAVKQIKPAGEVEPLPVGFKPASRPRAVAAMPTEDAWSQAARWTVTLPKKAPNAAERQFLRIRYTGDVMRLSAGGKLLDDNFADGRPWLVGLERFAPALRSSELEIAIYPLRKNPPIFFEPGLKPKVTGSQVDRLDSVELVREYRLQLRAEPTH